jgi:outer membrane protein insertion porin family
MKMGYFEQVTIAHELTDQGAAVVINVVERQRIEKVVFVGNTVLSEQELAQAILTRPGHLVDEQVIAKDILRIQSLYQRHGYLCNVPSAAVDRYGVLTFIINEMRIEGFVIEGLRRTRKWIVERQIKLQPGQLYRDSLIREQVTRLRNLGLFEEVRIEPRPGKLDPENSLLIAFQCKEARTGQLALQMGYSSLDRFV